MTVTWNAGWISSGGGLAPEVNRPFPAYGDGGLTPIAPNAGS
jgi:hypothetical protein